MITVPQPHWRLTYNAKDVTTELAPYVLSVTYTDVLEGESDELSLSIEDRDHRWKNAWFPGKGAELALSMGYRGAELSTIGSFEIDEIEFSGPPDTVGIRALAAGVTKALRTTGSTAHEGRTLKEIADTIAEQHGLTLVGGGDNAGRRYERVTQNNETDLAFLNRLGTVDGVIFTIKDKKLVWHDQAVLDAATAVVTIDRGAMTQFSFRAATATTYRAAEVSYHDPKTKALTTHTETAGGASGDTLKLVERCENREQAQAKAQAALRAGNARQVEGSVTVVGNPALRAGCNVRITGLGRLDGVYQIQRAVHALDRNQGYGTTLELATPGTKDARSEA